MSIKKIGLFSRVLISAALLVSFTACGDKTNTENSRTESSQSAVHDGGAEKKVEKKEADDKNTVVATEKASEDVEASKDSQASGDRPSIQEVKDGFFKTMKQMADLAPGGKKPSQADLDKAKKKISCLIDETYSKLSPEMLKVLASGNSKSMMSSEQQKLKKDQEVIQKGIEACKAKYPELREKK